MKRFVILGMMLLLLVLQWESLLGQSYTMSQGQNIITCSGVFYDPGGSDGNYSNYLDITQTFASSDSNLCLQVTFSSFELEYYGSQKWDYLEIYDGYSTDAILIGKFCGNSQYGGDIPTTITSSSGALTFKFHSDGFTTAEGWVATFNCVECPPPPPVPSTEDNMHNGTDTIFCSQDPRPFYDPGGPYGDYGNNSNFTQTFVSSDSDKCLQVTFTSFAIEPEYDVLYVYDGVSSSGTLLGSYSGARTTFSVTSNSGALTFVFLSDNMFSYDGWEATISCVECSDPANNMHNGIDTVYCSRSSRLFYDPGGPYADYDFNVDIIQTFVSSDPDSCLQVTFTNIAIETRWDLLYVYDGVSTSGTLLGVYSGTYSDSVTLTSSTGALTFRFKSDIYTNDRGWEAIIRCGECAAPPPPLPPPPASDPCESNGVHPFCTDDNMYGITYSSGVSGDASAFLDKDSCSCLRSIPNPAWYYMQISDPGDLLINIQQVDVNNENHGLDVDFICWGPFTASSQSDFVDKLCNNVYTLDCYSHPSHHPADGNHQNDMGGYPDGNVVDCSYSIFETEWCYIPNAQLGEWYLLLITNYSEIPGTITFSVVDEYSTATTNCSLLAPVTYNAPLCQGDTLVLTCENPQTEATYHWSGPGGWTAVTSVPFVKIPNADTSLSGQYNLHITGTSSTVDSSSVEVTVHARPQVTVTASADSICSGNNVTLQATGAANYRWLSTSNISSSVTVAPDSTTIFAVVGTTGACSDTATYLVTVLRNTTGDTSAVVCGRFDWYEHEGLYESGDYTHTFTNAAGCDSVVTLHLTVGNVPVFTVYTNNTSICVGDTITLTAEADDESIPLSYRWSNGATASEITVSPDQTTAYTVTATNSYGCSDSLSLRITVGLDVSQTFYDTVCQGDGYDSYGFTLTAEETEVPGLHTLTSSDTNHGCIITTILLLTVQEEFDTTLYITACENYEWNDSVYTESGVYTEHYWNVNGCDSTVKLHLTIGKMFEVAITVSSDTICRGDSVMLTAEVRNGVLPDYSYHWSTDDTTSFIIVEMDETTPFAVTVADTVGCSASALREVEIFEPEPITDIVYRCLDSSVVMTARDAAAYQWNTGDTTQTVTATSSELYFVNITPFFGCPVVDTFKVVTMLVNGFSYIHIPDICAGGSCPVSVGLDSTSNLIVRTHETHLALHDTLFLPDSASCDSSGCYHKAVLELGNYVDTAHINSVDDIRYVRVNMEHSYAGDLYMKITCPNGQSADILRYGNAFQYENRGDCWDVIPLSSFNWQTGDTNANLSTCFGMAMDNQSSENPCDIMDADNAPGLGWNYCWSNNTSEGYTYADGEGSLVYRNANVIIPTESGYFHYVFDSSNVAAGTQFYHPDQSFENLVGCPLNGSWYIEVMDGNNADNGYIFGWELALAETYQIVEYADMSHLTLDGPWVSTLVSDSSFLILPPADLPNDTTVLYTFHGYSLNGCVYDTTVSVNLFANKISILDTLVCDSAFVWHGNIYTHSGTYCDTLESVHGCDSVAVLNLIISENPIVTAYLSNMVAGDTQVVTIGVLAGDNLHYLNPQATMCQSDTVFLPDGEECEPYGCSYRATLSFSQFPDTARIISKEDIRYVRLNMEHSYIKDLYINFICPNEKHATILKKAGTNSTSGCLSHIPVSERGWRGNAANVGEAFLGWANDVSDNDRCDPTRPDNAPGIGWNYCWSNNTTEGYEYAPGEGSLIYRSVHAHVHDTDGGDKYIIDSSNVANGSQFYHPDVSFDSLVECPLNGIWTVEVMDGIVRDNGYIFSCEIALSDRLIEHHYAPVSQKEFVGPWSNQVTDSTFVINPPANLYNDTVVTYQFTLISDNGCVYDTTVEIHIYAHHYVDLYDTVDVSELVSYSWNDSIFTGPGSKSIFWQTIHGADSVVTMHLSVIYSKDTTVCEDELPLQWGDSWFEEAGEQSVSYPVDGADSIIVLTLYKNFITYDTLEATVLQDDLPYRLNGYEYNETGTYSQTLTNVAGCDSLLTIDLTVFENVEVEVDSNICESALPFVWNGVTFIGDSTQTVTLWTGHGADSLLTMTVHVFPVPEAHISGLPVICNGDPAVLVADSAFAYHWSNEATTQSVSVLTTGRYTLTVTNEYGCFDTASVQVFATVMHPIDSIVLPPMCAGNVYTFSIGHQSSSNIIIGSTETTLSMTDTVFLPDGVSCQPYGCSYQSPLTFTAYPDDAVVNDVNDILYVRLNMEHSYAADLYIKLTCPDGQKADILRFKGHEGSQYNGECMSTIPYASRGWQNGNNASGGTFLGMAYDHHSSLSCNPNVSANAPGRGWNYCWSNNTSEGYSYAPGAGSLIYRSVNANSYNNLYYEGYWGSEPAYVTIFDSSDVASGTKFYHPDESFSNLIGCHLNGSWKIEVIDGLSLDNGYIFAWELALAPEITMVENTDVSRVEVEGPWMERVNDTVFLMSPPATLKRDTTVQYLFSLFDVYGCSYDTILSVTFYAKDTVEVDTTVCDRFVWNNITYEESGRISQSFENIHGCDSTVMVNLTVVPSPQVSISGPSLLCADSMGILSVDSSISYLWSTGDTTRVITIFGSGNYSVTVTESHGCSSLATHHVSSPANAIVSVSMPNICADSSCSVTMGTLPANTVVLNQNPDLFTLDIQGSWLYNDEEGAFTVIPPVDLTQDTMLIYTFMLTDTSGCRFDTVVSMTVYPLIHSTIDTVACDSFTYNDSVYTASGSFNHYFSTSHGCDSTITINLTIHYSDTTYDTLYLVENDLPYYFEPADIYFITPEDMTFQYTLETHHGCDSVIQQQVYIYSNVTRTLDTTVCSLPFEWCGHTFTAAGSITDTFKTFHNNDSLVTYTVNVDEISASIRDIVQIVCFGASTGAAVATVTGGQNPMNYEWKDDGDNAVSSTTQLNDAAAGLYTFTVTDLLGCLASDTMTLRYLHDELNPGSITGDQSVCLGSALEDFMGEVASGGDNGVYQWQLSQNGGDWTVAPGIANQQNYTYPEEPSVSTFRLRRAWISASCGVAFSDTVEVEVWPGYIDTISAAVCQGEAYMENGFEVDETMTSNPGAFTFEKTLSTGHCDSVIILQLVVNQNYESIFEEVVCEGEDYADHGFVIPASETVDAETLQRTLTLTTAQGCDSVLQLHLTVVDTALRIISLTPDFCEELSAVLVVETELSDYEWNTGESMPQITVTMPGSYSVTASQGGCEATAKYVIEPCELQLFLPNAITPSRGDGLNDYFSIPEAIQRSIYDFEISIFNRWGEMVFYSTDKGFRWNGEVNGTIYPNNVYTYIVRCTNAIGKPHTFTGSVTVL